MNLDNLTAEQTEKAKACKTADELLDLAKAEGVELTDEQLEGIAGGSVWEDEQTGWAANCPACGKTISWPKDQPNPNMCPYCGTKLIFNN